MKRLTVYMDEDFHEDMRELARRKKTTMAALVRYSLDATFEDDLDAIAGQRGLDEALAHPETTMSLDDFLKERSIILESHEVKSRHKTNAPPGSTNHRQDGASDQTYERLP